MQRRSRKRSPPAFLKTACTLRDDLAVGPLSLIWIKAKVAYRVQLAATHCGVEVPR